MGAAHIAYHNIVWCGNNVGREHENMTHIRTVSMNDSSSAVSENEMNSTILFWIPKHFRMQLSCLNHILHMWLYAMCAPFDLSCPNRWQNSQMDWKLCMAVSCACPFRAVPFHSHSLGGFFCVSILHASSQGALWGWNSNPTFVGMGFQPVRWLALFGQPIFTHFANFEAPDFIDFCETSSIFAVFRQILALLME